MENSTGSSWEKIQRGVKDTERLIGQKDYNTAMIKARQTLEFMVKQLAEKACIVEGGDLMEIIDTLYQNRWITKTTCEHYHKIRIIGNKAVHEGDNNAYNANQCYHMLSQEVYTFAHDYRGSQRGAKPVRQPASRQSSGRPASSGSRRRAPQKGLSFTVYDLLKLLIPVLIIVLIFLIVRLVRPADSDPSTTQAVTTTAESTDAASESTDEPAATAAITYKTTDVLNVRPEPSTTSERLGQLAAGATVEYIRDYDDEWAVIRYNGQEAYVASQYLTRD